MDYQAFVRQLDRGEAPPIALLHGGDSQLLDDALDAATRGLFPDRALAAWGREVFDGRERGVDEIVRSAMTLPLGSGRRLVAVRRAQALAAKGADVLTVYAASPNPATCLLLLADEPLRASRERRVDHWLLAGLPATAIVELPTRGSRELAGWLRQRAALEGLTITDEAARLLVELTGEDPLLLSVLARDVRTAWTALAWRCRGRPVEEIARTLRRPPAVIEALTGPTSGSEALLARRLRRCWDADRRLKSSGEPRAEMAALVADLCAER